MILMQKISFLSFSYSTHTTEEDNIRFKMVRILSKKEFSVNKYEYFNFLEFFYNFFYFSTFF